MGYYYAATTGGFYSDDEHKPEQIPADAKPLTDEEYRYCTRVVPTSGQRIVPGADGSPIAAAQPAPTDDDLFADAQLKLKLLSVGAIPHIITYIVGKDDEKSAAMDALLIIAAEVLKQQNIITTASTAKERF